ncbi:MAG: hypothetical protein ACR2QJ_11330 [Geminicoccaceae bacterium]
MKPGQQIRDVRAIACNKPDQLETILNAYSVSYHAGKAAFEAMRAVMAFDAAMGRQAPVCDEVGFAAIVPVSTVSSTPYSVHFADGSIHRRYIIEVKPVGPDRKPAEASYFISSRWRVRDVDRPA